MDNQPLNPYQTTASVDPNAPGGTAKPTSITVFAILNLVFGVLGLCGTVAAGAFLFMPAAAMQGGPTAELMQTDWYRIYMAISLLLGFIATIVLLVSGVGLLNSKPYGRTAAIGYAIYALISGLIGFVINIVFVVLPITEQIPDLPEGPERAGAIGGMIGGVFGGVFGGCIGLLYPIALLFFMTRPHVKA